MSLFDFIERQFGRTNKGQSTQQTSAGGESGEKAPAYATTDADFEENILIGVCGVSGAGKTVFFSAVYHTLTYVEGLGRISFDNRKGDPSAFEVVDNQLRAKGTTDGTTRLHSVVLIADDPEQPGILLLDFMGGQFSDFADPNSASGDKAELAKVHTFIERCDAIILLIKSTMFGPVRSERTDSDLNPWVASARKTMDVCLRQKKPMALVLTQADLNEGLDLETIRTFPWVCEFEGLFQSEDPHRTDTPFGLVRLLSCYKADRFTMKPVQQGRGNTIYLPQPGILFKEMLLAALPQAKERIRKAAQAKADAITLVKKRKRSAFIAKLIGWLSPFLVAGLVFLATLAHRTYVSFNSNRADVETVSEMAASLQKNLPEMLSDRDFAALDRVRKRLGKADADEAIGKLQRVLEEAMPNVAPSVYHGDTQKAATENLIRLAQYFPVTDERALGLLKVHAELLRAGCSGSRQPGAAASAPRDSKGYADSLFASTVIREADSLRVLCADSFANTMAQIESEPLKTLEALHNQLLEDRSVRQDARWMLAKKRAYARILGATLTGGLAAKKISQFVQQLGFISDNSRTTGNNFKQIIENVRKLDRPGDVREKIRPLLHGLSQNEPEFSNPLRYALGDLFDHVAGELDDREALWSSLFDGMESKYYFAVRADAWPPKQRPQKDSLREELKRERHSRQIATSVIDQISEHPMYWWEVASIATLLSDLDFANQCGPAYGSVLEQLGAAAPPGAQPAVQPIQTIADMASAIYRERKDELGIESPPIRKCGGAALNLLRSIRTGSSLRSPNSMGFANRPADLQGMFRRSCGPLLRKVGAPGAQ